MTSILETNPTSKLNVKVSGQFGNGGKITGAAINRVASDGSRWITVYYKGYSGTSARILPDGSLDTSECADDDIGSYQAAYSAAIEQYT